MLAKISPRIGRKQYPLTMPTLSPEARRRRRLMRRNDRKLYKTTCIITHKSLVTIYHPDIEKNIADHMERYKSVDNMQSDMSFNFFQTFHEQLKTSMDKTIKKNILTV